MKLRSLLFVSILLLSTNLRASALFWDGRDDRDGSVAGLYKAVLQHDATKFYQFADVTLRTISTGTGSLKISANVKVYFGDRASTEFLSYEYDDCPLNLLTRQITIKNEKNNVSFVGFLKTGTLDGDWHSTVVGKVGKFSALKDSEPKPPADGILVKTLTGFYKGALVNTNPESNLPERATMSLVTTQDTSGPEPIIKISGNVRLYLGEFGSLEYVETKLTDVQFNFYNRYLTVRTADYGLTFKGLVSPDGIFTGIVFADGLGEVATANLKRTP